MIRKNKDLKPLLIGKKVLHTNSLGKDSVVCLEWLSRIPDVEIISFWAKLKASHPDDDRYFRYLQARYPKVKWIILPDSNEINLVRKGAYQTPERRLHVINKFEYVEFSRADVIKELAVEHKVDFVCFGHSRYESFTRATHLDKVGLHDEGNIYPIGNWKKSQLIEYIEKTGVKLHPCYKYSSTGYDNPSYWKMRNAIIAKPQYWKNLLEVYPELEFDKFRYEKLIKKEGKAVCR